MMWIHVLVCWWLLIKMMGVSMAVKSSEAAVCNWSTHATSRHLPDKVLSTMWYVSYCILPTSVISILLTLTGTWKIKLGFCRCKWIPESFNKTSFLCHHWTLKCLGTCSLWYMSTMVKIFFCRWMVSQMIHCRSCRMARYIKSVSLSFSIGLTLFTPKMMLHFHRLHQFDHMMLLDVDNSLQTYFFLPNRRWLMYWIQLSD